MLRHWRYRCVRDCNTYHWTLTASEQAHTCTCHGCGTYYSTWSLWRLHMCEAANCTQWFHSVAIRHSTLQSRQHVSIGMPSSVPVYRSPLHLHVYLRRSHPACIHLPYTCSMSLVSEYVVTIFVVQVVIPVTPQTSHHPKFGLTWRWRHKSIHCSARHLVVGTHPVHAICPAAQAGLAV